MMAMYRPIFVVLTMLSRKASGFAIVSKLEHSSAFGSALDVLGPKLMVAGVDSDDNNAHTNCYVSIGSDSDYNPNVLDSPKMCLNIGLFGMSSLLPDGVVTAMDGQQPMLFAMDYQLQPNQKPNLSNNFDLPSGRFPAVMTNDKNQDEGGVYVALHDTSGLKTWNAHSFSSGNDVRATWNYLRDMTYPNTLGTNSQSPIIYKYSMLDKSEVWQTSLNTLNGKTMITAMEKVSSRNVLVVVGSTTGSGLTIGAGAVSGGDWDGFITIVDSETGEINNINHGTYDSHSRRIKSQLGKDDLVLGLCMDDDKAYVVGSTTGKMEGDQANGAFIMKMDIDTLDLIWKKQIAIEGLEATHCAVEQNTLYVGGTVPSDKRLDYRTNMAVTGTIDIFASVYDAITGDVKVVRQIDSHRDDELVGMEIHPESGDVYITANAWDMATGTTNLYALSMDSSGDHAWQNLAAGQDPITGEISSPSPEDDRSIPTKAPTSTSNGRSFGNGSSEQKRSNGMFLAAAIIIPIAAVVGIFGYRLYSKRNTKMSQPPGDGSSGDGIFPIGALHSNEIA